MTGLSGQNREDEVGFRDSTASRNYDKVKRSYCDKKKSDKRAGLGGKKEMHRMMMPKTKENFKNTQETLPDMLAWQKLVSLMKYCIRSVGPS